MSARTAGLDAARTYLALAAANLATVQQARGRLVYRAAQSAVAAIDECVRELGAVRHELTATVDGLRAGDQS